MNNISQEANVISSSLIELDSLKPLLPRSAWNSNVAFLKTLFKAKKALDKLEQLKTN
jgi:hypothetical protein